MQRAEREKRLVKITERQPATVVIDRREKSVRAKLSRGDLQCVALYIMQYVYAKCITYARDVPPFPKSISAMVTRSRVAKSPHDK